uniref:Uncharacterized protein n=1 Tax=Anopheles minimus TaxID=112268 RepID=A0A182W0V1_9DIPT
MNGNLKKLLATASCLLVILYGSVDRAEGADHVATVDGILRSVVAVRSQLEPVLKFRLAQRTTALPQVTRMGGLSCGGTIRAPGLQRLFNCVPSENQPAGGVPTVSPINVQERVDDTPQYTPVELISADRKAGENERNRPFQEQPIRANPLGLIFPTLQQINQFNQWQRPYQSFNQLPVATVTTSSTTTVRPVVNDFNFPPSGDDRITTFTTVQPAHYYTTAHSSPSDPHGGQHQWETSTSSNLAGSDTTNDPLEEGTTEPPEEEEGLGNRIDNKLLLSLVG